jgi:hypothetical protein
MLYEKLDRFYLLSFLLTADHNKAEQCFVGGIEDSVRASQVFKDWVHSWVKRTIIQNAIRVLKPRPAASNSSFRTIHPVRKDDPADAGCFQFYRVLVLKDFERFVFVMSVLERYSDHECALLLGCSIQEIRETRRRAIQHMSSLEDEPQAAAAER